jgi:hypothetical protein
MKKIIPVFKVKDICSRRTRAAKKVKKDAEEKETVLLKVNEKKKN